MNLIEALKKADGKPVAREDWKKGDPSLRLVRVDCNMFWYGGAGEDRREARLQYFSNSALLADDWYVVEPKSPIKEAIEREVEAVREQQLFTKSVQDDKAVVADAMRRIVNLTLDEAKQAVNPNSRNMIVLYDIEISNRIDALKVKL